MTAYFISPQNIFFIYWRDHVILEITEESLNVLNVNLKVSIILKKKES